MLLILAGCAGLSVSSPPRADAAPNPDGSAHEDRPGIVGLSRLVELAKHADIVALGEHHGSSRTRTLVETLLEGKLTQACLFVELGAGIQQGIDNYLRGRGSIDGLESWVAKHHTLPSKRNVHQIEGAVEQRAGILAAARENQVAVFAYDEYDLPELDALLDGVTCSPESDTPTLEERQRIMQVLRRRDFHMVGNIVDVLSRGHCRHAWLWVGNGHLWDPEPTLQQLLGLAGIRVIAVDVVDMGLEPARCARAGLFQAKAKQVDYILCLDEQT